MGRGPHAGDCPGASKSRLLAGRHAGIYGDSIPPEQGPESRSVEPLICTHMNMKSEIIRVGQIGIRFLLDANETNGALAMFEFAVPAGARVPAPHSHAHYDETIYGVEGVMTFTMEGKPVPIGPGETCFIRRGVVHGFNNLQSVDA